MRMTCLVCVGVVACAPSPVRAESLATFWPAGCTYCATHIVVVTTEVASEGKFKVTESWKGDLKPGDALAIPGLAKDAKGDMALFMARNPDRKSAELWKPVGYEKWRVSVVWFDGEKVSAVEQHVNPGPAVVTPMLFIKSRKEFKKVVDFWLETERAFAAARAIKDPAARAAAFAKIVEGRYDKKDEAFEELGKCGSPALPALRAYLKGPLDFNHGNAVRALATAGGKDVVPELQSMLEEELIYWKKVGPTLRPMWLDGRSNEPNQRSWKLRALIDVYAMHPSPAYRTTVVATRDYLQALFAAEKDSGIGSLSKDCDAVLKKVDR